MTFTGVKTQIQQFLYKLELDKDKLYDVEIKVHRKHRNLDQNGKVWAIMTEMANILRIPKEEVYLSMLKSYGQRTYILLESNINPNEYFKYYELESTFTKNNKEFKSYLVFRGTSTYDTREMSIFIDGVVQEAEQLGINTEIF